MKRCSFRRPRELYGTKQSKDNLNVVTRKNKDFNETGPEMREKVDHFRIRRKF